MRKTLAVLATGIILSTQAPIYSPVYGQGITGGSTRSYQGEKKKEVDKSKENAEKNKKIGKVAEKVLWKTTPHGGLLEKAVKVGAWAAKKQVERGYSAGTSATTEKEGSRDYKENAEKSKEDLKDKIKSLFSKDKK